ncbi:MAG: hypothetical protein L6R39_007514, partial [Caloplaca ligustica]
ENIEFMMNYDKEHAEHLEELERIERDIERIEKDISNLGLQDGLFGPHDRPFTVDAPPTRGPSEERLGNRPWSPISEPERLQQQSSIIEEPPRRKSEADVWDVPDDPRSSRERINQWILERLKHSRIEKARHRAILNDPSLTREAWWSLVLGFWQHDRAAHSSPSSSRNVSGPRTPERPRALQESLDLVLSGSIDVSNGSGGGSDSAYLRLPAPSFTWPEGVIAAKTVSVHDHPSYCSDPGAGSLPETKKGREKRESVLTW